VAGGILGLLLSRNGQVCLCHFLDDLTSSLDLIEECRPITHVWLRPFRLVIDTDVTSSIVLTGWAMSQHAQALMISTAVSQVIRPHFVTERGRSRYIQLSAIH
jgi:hypothetical protein